MPAPITVTAPIKTIRTAPMLAAPDAPGRASTPNAGLNQATPFGNRNLRSAGGAAAFPARPPRGRGRQAAGVASADSCDHRGRLALWALAPIAVPWIARVPVDNPLVDRRQVLLTRRFRGRHTAGRGRGACTWGRRSPARTNGTKNWRAYAPRWPRWPRPTVRSSGTGPPAGRPQPTWPACNAATPREEDHTKHYQPSIKPIRCSSPAARRILRWSVALNRDDTRLDTFRVRVRGSFSSSSSSSSDEAAFVGGDDELSSVAGGEFRAETADVALGGGHGDM
jgi:hypothetical protein